MTYAAFLSYSHAADGKLCPAIQSALHQFAKPWYRLRAIRVFRDQTSLSANPALWPAIEKALGESGYFILLASPRSAQSVWVGREISWWLEHRSADKMLIGLTEGELQWNSNSSDFDWEVTSALPSVLRGQFKDEPLFVDLRWARSEEDLSLRNSRFRTAIVDVAATLHGLPKDELEGEDVRQYRKARRLASAAITVLSVLLIATGIAAVIAYRQEQIARTETGIAQKAQEGETVQRKKAEASAREAITQRNEAVREEQIALARQLAAQADLARNSGEMDRGLLLAAEGGRRLIKTGEPSLDVDLALRNTLSLFPHYQAHFDFAASVDALAFSPDGQSLFAVSDSGQAQNWDLRTKATRGFKGPSPYGTARNPRKTILTPGGRFSAWAADDTRAGVVVVWDVSGQREIARLDYQGSAQSLAMSANGEYLALSVETFSESEKRFAHSTSVWHLPSSTQIAILPGVYGADVDFAGHYLATSGDQAALWKITNDGSSKLAKVGDLPDAKQLISATFGSDGQYLATVNPDGIHILKLPELQESGPALKVGLGGAAVSAGGTYIAGTINGAYGNFTYTVSVFEVSSGREIAHIPQNILPAVVTFSPDGESLAVGRTLSRASSEVEVWRFASGSDRARASYNDAVSFLGMTGNETMLVAASRPKQSPGSTGEEYSLAIRISDLSDPKGVLKTVQKFQAAKAVLSSDGQYLLILHQQGSFRRFDVLANRQLPDPKCFASGPAIALAMEGGFLAFATSGSGGAVIRVCDLSKSAQSPGLSVDGSVSSMALDPDRGLLAVVTAARATRQGSKLGVELWHFRRGERASRIEVGFDMGVSAMALSRDASLFAYASLDGSVVAKRIADGRVLTAFLNQQNVNALAFSADSRYLAVLSDSATVWDLETQQELAHIETESDSHLVAFSPHARYLLTASSAGRIRVAYLSLSDLYQEACLRVRRNLPVAEWKQYLGSNEPYVRTCPNLPTGE
jgi:WD40 repeat protein